MANLIINVQNSFYQQVTAYRGTVGLGSPATFISSERINVPKDTIQLKLDRLRTLRSEFANYTVKQLEDFDAAADGNANYNAVPGRYAIRNLFYTRLIAILYPTGGLPSSNLASWFAAYETIPYKIIGKNKFETRDNVVIILNDWVRLLERILKEETEYAILEPSTSTPIISFNESSRTIKKYGTVRVVIQNQRIPLTSALLSASSALVNLKTLQFFDETREYKTVLNFGQDRQYLIEAWRPKTSDSSSIQLKLRRPLDSAIDVYNTAYITRDFAKTVLDTVNFELTPLQDTTPYLRPRNMDVGKFRVNNQSIKNVTLETLNLQTGSVGNISASILSYEDKTFNRWYTSDFNSSELNIDFSDYENFVFFGSAQARLDAFANKLKKINSYGNIKVNSQTSTLGEQKLALEVENIRRNFDPYEQFLYYASQSIAYSADTYYTDTGTEYHATGSWPKNEVTGLPKSYDLVGQWYATQSAIAQRFDEFNSNYLLKHLPEHIQEDSNSEDFIKFIQMFGHVMDNLKSYIDQFSYIYSNSPNPFDELSMDQTYEVAKSFGLDLPNAFSLVQLEKFISSLYVGEGARAFMAETWKRFLHSSIYLRKLKGTRTGTDAVLSTYGLNSPLVQVKESTYAVDGNYITSDESVYALFLTGSVSSSVRIPFVSSSYSASSIQLRFLPEGRQHSSILTTSGSWAVNVVPHPSASTQVKFTTQSSIGLTSRFTIYPDNINYGRLEVVSGSSRVRIASSSYFPLFSDVYTHIMLRSQSRDITIIQTDGNQILHQESASVVLGSLWNTPHVFINGTGSIKLGNFEGIVDDVRVWGEEITTDNFIKQAYDPGAYYGANYSSSYNSLYVDLSFSQPYAAITQSATNESPFSEVSRIQNLPTVGLTTASYVRILRGIKQFVPVVGSTIFSNKKITVAPPPVFKDTFIDENGTKILKLNGSIKSVEEKLYVGGQDYVQFAISPTDFVNQTIMRSMGDIDTNYIIGSPRKYNNETYEELDDIFEFFLKNYNETINVNQYIRFFGNMIKSPSDYIESYVPARSTLRNGIVIESPILQRQKTYIQKAIRVDGSNTVTFENFVSGSGSANVGAYDFLAEYPRKAELDTTIITKPVLQQFGRNILTSSLISNNGGIGMVDMNLSFTSSIGPVSSTDINDLPVSKQVTQKIGTANTVKSFASSSFLDNNSSVGFVDGTIDMESRNFMTQSGYPRNPYLGLRYDQTSQLLRIDSEVNTFVPIYAIPPRSDFSDVGTTTYFHLSSGLYWFDRRYATGTKEYKRAKISLRSGEIPSDLQKQVTTISLIGSSLLTDYPGRHSFTIANREYVPNVPYKGVLSIANIISLYYTNGTSGLRLRLYASRTDQENDLLRNFNSLPAPSANVLFDGLLTETGQIFPYTLMQTQNSTMYFTVDNVTASTISSEIKLTYFEYEPLNLVPNGYLPRHYRFSRTNNIAQRRYSHLGTKLIFCPEGCPPDVVDPNNQVGKVLPRRLRNGTISMPTQNFSTPTVYVFKTPRTDATVDNPSPPEPQIPTGTAGNLDV